MVSFYSSQPAAELSHPTLCELLGICVYVHVHIWLYNHSRESKLVFDKQAWDATSSVMLPKECFKCPTYKHQIQIHLEKPVTGLLQFSI